MGAAFPLGKAGLPLPNGEAASVERLCLEN